MFYRSKKIVIRPEVSAISDAIRQVQDTLTAWKVKHDVIMNKTLILEELLVRMAENDTSEPIHILLRKNYKRSSIRITMRGDKIASPRDMGIDTILDSPEELGPDAENIIRDIILRSSVGSIVERYSHGINTVDLLVENNKNAMAITIFAALILAVIVGVMLRLVASDSVGVFIANNVFMPLYDIFIRAIQIIMVPLVFFSLASSMMGVSDASSLGRTAGKVLFYGAVMSCISICISYCVNLVIEPGTMHGLMIPQEALAEEAVTDNGRLTIVNTLVDLMPDNFLGAFVQADMLQIIVLAILTGLSAAGLSKYSASLRQGIDAFSALFETMTMKVIKLMPLGVFGAMANLVLTVNVQGVLPLLAWIGEALLMLALVFLVMLINIFCFFRMTPRVFLQNVSEALIIAFSTASSSASMTPVMQCCKKMDIPASSYNFTVPFGISLNKAGTCGVVATIVLFLTSLYHVEITPEFFFTMAFSIILLIMATPGVPGALAAVMLVLLNQLDIPASGFMLFVSLIPLVENFETVVNVTCNIVTTMLVGKK